MHKTKNSAPKISNPKIPKSAHIGSDAYLEALIAKISRDGANPGAIAASISKRMASMLAKEQK